ncbi:MAG UNVERIFIED_CONTAM: hypothetical protein LVR18_43145 [Planctomycetaceae bacterium]
MLKESLGNGRTRVTFQLQQPVSGQLFVLGTSSAALPADRQIRMEPPTFVVPANAPATLSGQSHSGTGGSVASFAAGTGRAA